MQHFERTFKLSEKYIKDIEPTSEYYSQERNVRTSGHFLIIFFLLSSTPLLRVHFLRNV